MNFKLSILVALAACLALGQATSPKITTRLQEALAGKDAKVNIFVSMQEGIDKTLATVNAQKFSTRTARSTSVYTALTQNAAVSQKSILDLLDNVVAKDASVKVKSFWISNQVYIQGATRDLIESLAALEQVSRIDEESIHHIDPPVSSIPVEKRDTINEPEWHLLTLQATDVWAAPWGSNGSGVLVGVIDTGVRASHEAIRDQYIDDGHGWRDPYNQYRIPTDIYDHGTHVAGSVVGKDGIGVAPAARFIACKGYRDDGSALASAFFECGQFLVCPTDVDGNNPDCTKTIHVAQNSWGLSLGGGSYKEVLDVWHAVGIQPIFANGNYGSTCGIVYSPADNIGAIGIGATDINDRLASFSGRGPSEFGILKPDYSAPGVNIYSCDRRSDTSYSIKSGTSMASPVAAGAAALMVGAKPDVTYAQLKHAFESTATRQVPALGQTCGGVPDTTWPNNAYGHGRINAYQAIQSVLNLN